MDSHCRVVQKANIPAEIAVSGSPFCIAKGSLHWLLLLLLTPRQRILWTLLTALFAAVGNEISNIDIGDRLTSAKLKPKITKSTTGTWRVGK